MNIRKSRLSALIIPLVALMSIASCMSCAATSANSPWGSSDRSAAEHQRLMKQSVLVTQKYVYANIYPHAESVPGMGVGKATGSGVVVAVDNKSGDSLIMTAGHVCKTDETVTVVWPNEDGENEEHESPVIALSMSITNIEGQVLSAKIIDIDPKNDLCTLSVKGKWVSPAPIASSEPPLGADLVSPGAPAGMYTKWMSLINTGILAGVISDDEENRVFVCTIPAVGGASGSGIFYRGQVVGILIKVRRGFEHSAMAVTVPDIQACFKRSLIKWHQ